MSSGCLEYTTERSRVDLGESAEKLEGFQIMKTISDINSLEMRRLELQHRLDSNKSFAERNRLGQFATPTSLAREIVTCGVSLLPNGAKIRFLDPAIGSGSFFSALASIMPKEKLESCVGYEIDGHYGRPSKKLWKGTPLKLNLQDFTQVKPRESSVNLLICNPPYVRHHHLTIEQKQTLRRDVEAASGMKLSGLAGLYCYFMGLSHTWMAEGGIAGWLVPSEFMGVKYGEAVRRYLLERVTLLRVHRFDPRNTQFKDALVSSAVVLFRNSPPPANHKAVFSYGGSLLEPAHQRSIPVSSLSSKSKWTRYPQVSQPAPTEQATLGDLFEIKRGLVTGSNSFFILDRTKIQSLGLPMEFFTPILPGPRYLPDDEVLAGESGLPKLDRQLFLLQTQTPRAALARRHPALNAYLEDGESGSSPVSERYVCRHRSPWYAQEYRPPAPILCTYMGRRTSGSGPFRFILNWSQATAGNVYLLLYPKPFMAQSMEGNPDLTRRIWAQLNGIDAEELIDHGRVYGGGLHKLEPKELRGFPAGKMLHRLGLALP